jgi:alkylation response protein AidB-like acyl-CoA dehydrogenase
VERDREERCDVHLIREAGELGLLGLTIPEQYGGRGLSHTAYAAALEEMSRHDHLIGLAMTFPSGLAGAGLLSHGTHEQREQYLTPLCRGEQIASAAVTEPSSGTDVPNMHTRCRREGDTYVIDGRKTWISYIGVSDWILTFASLDPGGDRKAICAFIVPSDAPGLAFRPFKNKLGFRAIASGDIDFEGVRVPAENRLGEEGQGLNVAMSAVVSGRLGVAARALGIAQDCFDRSVEYSREREVFGRPIGRYQLVQSMVTDMVVGLEGAREMTRRLAELRDANQRANRQASLAKMHATDVAMRTATAAVQIHGAYGIREDAHVGRHFRDAKVMQIIEGHNQLHRALVSEYTLGFRS